MEELIEQLNNITKQLSFDDINEQKIVLQDKEDNQYALIPAKALNKLLSTLAQTKEENFELKLEKTIWKYVPIDFADTWAVAMHELKQNSNQEISDATLNNLVKNIKKNHPNLFLNIDDFLPSNAISEIRHIG